LFRVGVFVFGFFIDIHYLQFNFMPLQKSF